MTSGHRGLAARIKHLLLALSALSALSAAVAPSADAQVNYSGPSSFGGTAERKRLSTSNAPVKFDQKLTQEDKKPKKLSAREKREAGGGGLNRGAAETATLEAGLGKAIDRNISALEKSLGRLSKTAPERSEVMRLLIERYHQKSLLVFFQESRSYDAAWQRWDQSERQGEEPQLNQKASQAWTSRVVQRAQQFITEYPKHKRVDEAYFQIAFAFDGLGMRKQAATYYSQIVAKFPNSRRVPDAHFALGEYYFDQQDFKKSLAAYQQVERFPRSNSFPYAVYKTAWSLFNLQQYRNALGQFQRVVSMASSAPGMSPASKVRLREDTLRDMIPVWVELNDVNGAERYYASVTGGDKFYGDLLLKLAEVLRERGEYDQSVLILKRFTQRNPSSIKAAEIQLQIVETANQKSDKALLWAEMRYMLQSFKPGTAWAQKNEKEKEYKELVEKVHDVSLNYAKAIHAQAQKANIPYWYQQAEIGYTLYLTHYGDRKEAGEIRFLLGEIQYANKRYPDALKTFQAIALQKEKTPYFQKAAEYTLDSAYVIAEKDLKETRARAAKLGAPPVPIPQSLQDYVKICDQHIQWFPKAPAVEDCQIQIAEIYLKHNQYEEAEKRILAMAKAYPDKPLGQTAASNLLFLASKDEKKLVQRAEELAKVPQFNQGKIGEQLREIRLRSDALEASNAEKGGDTLAAAKRFEKLAAENPKAADADKFWFNAGVNYRKANEMEKAVGAFGRVYTGYEKSSQGPEAMLAVIEISEDRLQLERAAQIAELFLKRYPQDKRTGAVARGACLIVDALNDVNRAKALCVPIALGKGPEARSTAFAFADLLERNRRYADLIAFTDGTLMRLSLNDSERAEQLVRAMEAEKKLGKGSNVARREQQLVALYRKNPNGISGDGLTEMGRIEFEKQLPVYNKFKQGRVTANKPDGSDLFATLKQREAAVGTVEAAFKKVIDVKDAEWSVAAIFMIGTAYERLASDYVNAPLPGAANEEQKKKLRETFATVAKGYQDKSKALYRQAAEVVSKQGVYSDYGKQVADALARVDSGSYRKLEEWLPSARFVGSEWTEFSASRKAIELLAKGER